MLNVVALLTAKHAVSRPDHGEAQFWKERGGEYAAKLFAGVDRWLTVPHANFLITDSPELAPKCVEPLPVMGPGAGWWAKLLLFHRDYLGRTTLYLDLDNVVCGPLDALASLAPDPLMMVDDVAYPRLRNGSTMLFQPHPLAFLYDEYELAPREIEREFSEWPNAADQAFIAHRVERLYGTPAPLMQDLLPAGYILNARTELEQGADYSKASLVFGSWKPKPHESDHAFYKEHWRL
jgi:hypothetical protein